MQNAVGLTIKHRNGRRTVVADEICTCGHSFSEHRDARKGLIGRENRGRCRAKGCRCFGFTFKRFVYEKKKKEGEGFGVIWS